MMNCPHCETEIDEHEAGRETDACVAEAVMGEARNTVGGWSPHDDESGITLDVNLSLSHYSTDIAAAWEVIEKLIADGFFPGVGYEENTWDAWVFREEPIEGQMGSHVKARNPNAHLAICRAALKAIYVGEDGK